VGAAQPAIGLGRLLAEQGHHVRILGPARFAARISAAGARHRPLPPEAEFNPALGRGVEDQADYFETPSFGAAIPIALAAELASEPADVVVVDYLRALEPRGMAERERSAFVLVHGAWHDGRVWDPLREIFAREGHRSSRERAIDRSRSIYPVTMSALTRRDTRA